MATVIHAIIGYFFLLLLVRVLKRRAGSQTTLFEFVLIFLIGGVIILSTVGSDRSVTNCTTAVIAVGLMHRSLSFFKTLSPRLGILLDGTPLVLISQGEWMPEIVTGMKITPEDVLAAARTSGLSSLDEVDYAILERNGRISIFPKDPSTAQSSEASEAS